MNGILYGVGVGPGAPDLLTLRAVKVLGEVDVILAAASPRNDFSAALDTARPHLRPDVRVQRLEFPMTRDRSVLREAWRRRAQWLALAVFASGVGIAAAGMVLPVWVDDTVSIVWWGLAAMVVASPLVITKAQGSVKKRKAL